MPGTRTAPTVDGTASWLNVSMTMLDYTGDQRTVTLRVDNGTTNAEIETLVEAVQALTNATIYRVTVGSVYNAVGDSSDALEEVWEDIKTNAVFLAKNDTDDSANLFVPAPINAMFIEGTEEIDPGFAPLATALTAWLATRAGYNVVSGRFTQRRSIGVKVNI